jgi:uncharacterized protein YqfA (UPF0365 family)
MTKATTAVEGSNETALVPAADNTPKVATVSVGGVEVKVKSMVTVPTLKHETGQVAVFMVKSPLQYKKSMKATKVVVNGEKVDAEEEITIVVARVIELSTGQYMDYVFNTIAESRLQSVYPNNSYVNIPLAVKKGGVREGKRYKDVDIAELEMTSKFQEYAEMV